MRVAWSIARYCTLRLDVTARPTSLPDFDPVPHREALVAIVRAITERIASGDFDAEALDGILRRHPRAGRGFFSRSEIIAGYRSFFEAGIDTESGVSEEAFLACVQRRPVRTQSGVTPLTASTPGSASSSRTSRR